MIIDTGGALRKLLDGSGLSVYKFCEVMNMSEQTVNAIMRGRYSPKMATVVRIADFFAVPLDFLCGRCTEEQARQILDNYAEHFQELRRAAYEDYLKTSGCKPFEIPAERQPYPYNLLHDLDMQGRAEFPGFDESRLDKALETLSEREQQVIALRYKNGLTFDKMSHALGVSRTRAKQLVQKIIVKLRHPMYYNEILGLNLDYEAHMAAIKTEEEKLNGILAEIKERIGSGSLAASWREFTPIAELGLSVRSYNVLTKAGCETVFDVRNLMKRQSISELRNAGKKTEEEVRTTIRKFLGESYEENTAD